MSSLSGPAGLPPEDDAPIESIWRSPLLCAALAFTFGIVLDRFLILPFPLSLAVCGVALLAFLIARLGRPSRLSLVYLALAGAALGAGYHHFRREMYSDDDIGRLVASEPMPGFVRGLVEDEPRRLVAPDKTDPLRSLQPGESAATVLEVHFLSDARGERGVSGRVRLVVSGPVRAGMRELLADVHPGDMVEVRGRLSALAERSNPDEFDMAEYWRDRGVRALLLVRQGDAAVVKVQTGWMRSFNGWVAVLRGWGHRTLDEHLPDRTTRGVARALLLGEGAPMTTDDWSKYVRTGVVHVLAISGQHLVVVGWFLWVVLRALGVRQRRAAVLVALVLLGYALLTGARPPALRSGIAACAVCGGLVLRRPLQPANLFALAWLGVVLVNPTDAFDPGCQLSFLSVAVLCWGASWILRPKPEDPLDTLIDQYRPLWGRCLRWMGAAILKDYLVCLIVWVAIMPLAAYHSMLFAPFVLLLGPPLTLLTSIALFAGFALLALAPWFSLGATVAGWVLWAAVWSCEKLVDLTEIRPMHVYIGPVAVWWVFGFYGLLLAVLTQAPLRQRWCWALPAGLGWLCVVLVSGAANRPEPALRCTFLAVGHGGCTVLEMPDGRVVLYDSGAIRGPDVGARVIAPFLWSRKIYRIDDLILSHADLDHFNGLEQILDRFSVGRVLYSPTFPEKPSVPVRYILEVLERRRVRVQTVTAGQRLTAPGVTLEVLHPPAGWVHGNENARSIVLEVRTSGHNLLLTGDLEGEGLAKLLTLPPRRVDILQAPHHGSHRIDVAALVQWCRPSLVLSSQGAPRGAGRAPGMYRQNGCVFWSTHEHGAITIRWTAGLEAETFLTGQRWRPAGR